jgi:hypothetical protein
MSVTNHHAMITSENPSSLILKRGILLPMSREWGKEGLSEQTVYERVAQGRQFSRA